MKKLIERIQRIKHTQRKRRNILGGNEWMKTQLLRMIELNQGLVRMSGGR